MSEELTLVKVQGKHTHFNVYVQGSLDDHKKTIILTVHDVGANHKSFVNFVDHPSMAEVKKNAIFLHVCVPGQEDNAPDFTEPFPTLAQMGEDLACVLDKIATMLPVKPNKQLTCIAFGEGAGANIICRFALNHPNRISGIILVHCTSTTVGVLEYFRDKLTNLRLENDVMSQGAWEFLTAHKFGSNGKSERQEYINELKTTMNPKNLSKYLAAFAKRTDFSTVLGAKLDSIDALLVTGSRAPHIQTVYNTHKIMNKKKTTLLVVDNVTDVMVEAPDNLARSLILLCKGCGLLSGVGIPGMERQRTLSSSMEDADRPRRFSIPQQQTPVTTPTAVNAGIVAE